MKMIACHAFLITLALIIPPSLKAQTAELGKVTLNNGKQKYGYIDYRAFLNNPTEIKLYDKWSPLVVQIKTEKDIQCTTYKVSDLTSWLLFGGWQFDRATVSKTTIRKNDTERDTSIIKAVWLQKLVEGNLMSLYRLRNAKERCRLYLREEKTGEYTELIEAFDSEKGKNDHIYKLSALATKYKFDNQKKLMQDIEESYYCEEDLIPIVVALNKNGQSYSILSPDYESWFLMDDPKPGEADHD